ncbi:hypothetical protein [Hathewaya massiliensis]|uniref:hypothetical protein n=1 Tax=Hathewaya massiliensis TaxID=1964382 RepID=UPI00115950D2|nr:hypothetical protein [Hathewaya massiliensis]
MSKNKKLLILMPLFFMAMFLVTYGIVTIKNNKNQKVSTNKNEELREVKEKIGIDNSSNSIKIIYESVYSKPEGSNNIAVDEYIEKFSKDKEVIGDMTKEQVVAAFKKDDYSLKDIKKNQIIFSRSLDKYKYSPNKYVIGIKDGYVAIFKVNKDGNLAIESPQDITDINIKDLPEGDVELLNKGDKIYEFNSKEEAIEGLEGIFRT